MIKKKLYSIKHFFDHIFLERTGISIKKDSYIKRPYTIEGGKYIQIGSNVSIREYSKLACYDKYAGKAYKPTIIIGNSVFANRFFTVLSAGELVIGNNTFLGSYVSITNENHGTMPDDICYGLQPLTTKPVKIGSNCWIGDHATILPGVCIGDYSIIAAGSVVTKTIPSYCIAAGNPAKIIKCWNKELHCWERV
jgi:lipopolysaccharide O-acetyltransferase